VRLQEKKRTSFEAPSTAEETPPFKAPNTAEETPIPQHRDRERNTSTSSEELLLVLRYYKMSELKKPNNSPSNPNATVSHPIQSQPPSMTAGQITPKVTRDFKARCRIYFQMGKDKVPEGEQTSRILGCFEDKIVADWADTERETLVNMTFTEFMATFHEQWLPREWEQAILTKLEKSHLDPNKESFEVWTQKILSQNTTLRNTSLHLSKNNLRKLLKSLLDEELCYDRGKDSRWVSNVYYSAWIDYTWTMTHA